MTSIYNLSWGETSFLAKLKLFFKSRKQEKKCIHAALAKNPEKAHTRGLLRIGLAEIYRHEGDWRNAETEMHVALLEAVKAEEQDPRQAARIYRRCANIMDYLSNVVNFLTEEDDDLIKKCNPGDKLRNHAQELVRATDARDQLLNLYRL